MKKNKYILIWLIMLFISAHSLAQTPQKFNYQAVCRDGFGNIIAGQTVSVRLTLHDLLPAGAVLYQETHITTTNNFGLVNLAVGNGTVNTGNFAAVLWGTGDKYLEVELDAGSGFQSLGTSQLLSVPYALYAEHANVPGLMGPTGPQGTAGVEGATGATGPEGPVAGADQQLIYNNNGTSAGASNFYFNNVNQNVGISTTVPHSSALLEISGTTRGFLPPRLTGTHILAISSPAEGLTVYNTCSKTLNVFNGTMWVDMSGSKAIPVIGDTFAGGIVFYIDPLDCGHGLVCAPSDQSATAQWGCYGSAITGADGTTIGTGTQNTTDIVNGCATAGIAARLCYDLTLNGYDDWFLPSKDELDKMYDNLKTQGIGGFADAFYWSSSETSDIIVNAQNFTAGYQINNASKNNPYHVRAVRAF